MHWGRGSASGGSALRESSSRRGSTLGGGSESKGVCIYVKFASRRGSALWGGGSASRRGSTLGGGSASRVGWVDPPIGYYGIRQRASSMHPTGMHSCLNVIFYLKFTRANCQIHRTLRGAIYHGQEYFGTSSQVFLFCYIKNNFSFSLYDTI